MVGLFLLIFLLGCTEEDPGYPSEALNESEANFQTQPEEDTAETTVQAQVIINGHVLTNAEIQMLTQTYGKAPIAGNYWYDARSGLQGAVGSSAAGYLQAGHTFGTVSQSASNGNTGVILNGRELTQAEAVALGNSVGGIVAGNYWLDAQGNLGIEGESTARANVYASSSVNGGGGSVWSSSVTGAGGGSQGDCSYVNIPGDTGVSAGFVSSC